MAEPFIGEIKLMGFDWAPEFYAKCDGALVPITQNPSLFSLMGSAYGGDGTNNFALPDMRGRTPVGEDLNSSDYQRGWISGFEKVTLNQQQIGGHTHQAMGSSQNGNRALPSPNTCLATSPSSEDLVYGPPTNLVPMKSDMISPTGGNQGHSNMQPYLAINFCIALQGTYPSRT